MGTPKHSNPLFAILHFFPTLAWLEQPQACMTYQLRKAGTKEKCQEICSSHPKFNYKQFSIEICFYLLITF